MFEATRERNHLEALLHGWSVILAAATAVVVAVLALMLACGSRLEGQHFGMPLAGLLTAGVLALLARTPS